jgi:predicted transcriptional regulator
MPGISLHLPEDVSASLVNLAKANGQSADFLALDVLRDFIAEQVLTQLIERRVQEADAGLFATPEEVAALKNKRWDADKD